MAVTIKWVDDIPGRPGGPGRYSEMAVLNQKVRSALSERPGQWARIEDAEDKPAALKRANSLSRKGFRFAVRQVQDDPPMWAVFGQCRNDMDEGNEEAVLRSAS